MRRLFVILLMWAGCLSGFPQGVFQSNLAGEPGSGNSSMTLSGYIRGTGFIGMIKDQDPLLHGLYSETSLKLKARAGDWGQAFTDLRFRAGTEFGSETGIADLREAYTDIFAGRFDFRIGKQITSWGRADGLNPTDNLCPKDYFFRSPDPDDMRLGTFLLRGRYNPFGFLRIEVNAGPWYTPSRYRFDLIDMPAFVSFNPVSHPGFAWDKVTLAGKADLIFPAFEGSLSWFRGYDPLPAIKPGNLPQPPFTEFSLQLLQEPFLQQTLGADFVMTLLRTGLRGEIAYKMPEDTGPENPFIPKKELQWVVSLDRGFGPFRLIAGYSGKFVDDFIPSDPPADLDPSILADPSTWPLLEQMLTTQISYYNRVLFDQTCEISHTLLLHPTLQLFHETLDLEFTALWNMTTEEYMLYPKIKWNAGGGLEASLGYQYYEGPDYTRFKWIKDLFTGPFLEVRLSF